MTPSEQLVWWMVETSGHDESTIRDALRHWDKIEGPGYVLIKQGTEVHVFLSPEWRGKLIRRKNVREFIAPLLAEHEFLTTRLPCGSHNKSFVERVGFKHTWTDGTFDYFMLTSLPFERRHQ